MESTQLLNVLINAFYYILLITSVVVIGLFIYVGLFDNSLGFSFDKTTFSIMDSDFAGSLSIKDYFGILFSILTSIFFIKSIYHLRGATLRMIKGEIFNHVVAMHLKWTGISIVLYKVFVVIGEFYREITYESKFTIGFDFKGFESSIFLLILGLFFMLLSKVIQNGISMKSENDLTI